MTQEINPLIGLAITIVFTIATIAIGTFVITPMLIQIDKSASKKLPTYELTLTNDTVIDCGRDYHKQCGFFSCTNSVYCANVTYSESEWKSVRRIEAKP